VAIENLSFATCGWRSDFFWLPPTCGDQNVFDCHSHVATGFSHHLVAMTKFGCHQMAAIYFNHFQWIFLHFWSPFKKIHVAIDFVSIVRWSPIWKRFYEGIWV
jgi:hypothetical protein